MGKITHTLDFQGQLLCVHTHIYMKRANIENIKSSSYLRVGGKKKEKDRTTI